MIELDKILQKLKDLPFESKKVDDFERQVNLIDSSFNFILGTNPLAPEDDNTTQIKELLNHLVGLSYSLQYIPPIPKSDIVRKKMNRIGYFGMSLTRLHYSSLDKEYFAIISSAKSLIFYDEDIMKGLSFELNSVLYKRKMAKLKKEQ